MSASLGNLDGLVGYSFASDDASAVAAGAYTSTGSGPSLNLVTLSGTTNGASNFFPAGTGVSWTIANVLDSSNLIEVQEMLNGQPSGGLAFYNVIGFSQGSLLIANAYTAQQIAQFLSVSDTITVDQNVIAISTTALPSGTALSFATAGTFGSAPPCFSLGTRILTGRGEVAVEDLRAGDTVPTRVGGRDAPVCWIGRRTVSIARHPRPWDVAPVRVRAGAFAPGQPGRDLLLSPDHAVQVGAALIPVRYLLNGASIAQEFPESVTYFHVELDAHDVLLAEGLPCESYLDTGNRDAFANAEGPVRLLADFARAVWAKCGCLPLRLDGPEVAAARRRLLARALRLGWRRTRAPALHLLADGRPVRATRHGTYWRAALPPGVTELRLCSRAAVPAELSVEPAGDARRLGVAIAQLRLDGSLVAATCFGTGWHPPEDGWRWTDGDARLHIRGAREASFAVALVETYWRPPVPRTPERRAA
jgi:hypothetical protein